ncbi:MAG: fructosamine kinase family protein, partial [Melioribacteraceae bacterium]|nr:fructosamine kinase family protein [Melioribacteraceae bacterium]
GEKIISDRSVGGGCIADARIIQTESGKKYFLKSYGSNSSILLNEANGLKELAKADAVRIPKVIFCEETFLLLEHIEGGNKKSNFSEEFGRQFAQMHKYTGEQFGFYENNFIGSNPQINLPAKKDWTEFFWENRLLYQFKLAERNGYVNTEFRSAFEKFEKAVPKLISGSEEEPALLHGDLWSGNYMVDENGAAVLIDPAVYYGHREADLAMTKLFGGFDSAFYSAYNEEFPLPDGSETRVDLYKLYHVMNHLNLFGTGYYSQTISIIKNYI